MKKNTPAKMKATLPLSMNEPMVGGLFDGLLLRLIPQQYKDAYTALLAAFTVGDLDIKDGDAVREVIVKFHNGVGAITGVVPLGDLKNWYVYSCKVFGIAPVNMQEGEVEEDGVTIMMTVPISTTGTGETIHGINVVEGDDEDAILEKVKAHFGKAGQSEKKIKSGVGGMFIWAAIQFILELILGQLANKEA